MNETNMKDAQLILNGAMESLGVEAGFRFSNFSSLDDKNMYRLRKHLVHLKEYDDVVGDDVMLFVSSAIHMIDDIIDEIPRKRASAINCVVGTLITAINIYSHKMIRDQGGMGGTSN